MIIGERLKQFRESKGLSQGDIEKRTGLLRCYISRVENGHTTPSIETLEKFARSLSVPIYALFYDGEEPPKAATDAGKGWGSSGVDARTFSHFRRHLAHTKPNDRKLLLHMAQQMANRKGARKEK